MRTSVSLPRRACGRPILNCAVPRRFDGGQTGPGRRRFLHYVLSAHHRRSAALALSLSQAADHHQRAPSWNSWMLAPRLNSGTGEPGEATRLVAAPHVRDLAEALDAVILISHLESRWRRKNGDVGDVLLRRRTAPRCGHRRATRYADCARPGGAKAKAFPLPWRAGSTGDYRLHWPDQGLICCCASRSHSGTGRRIPLGRAILNAAAARPVPKSPFRPRRSARLSNVIGIRRTGDAATGDAESCWVA